MPRACAVLSSHKRYDLRGKNGYREHRREEKRARMEEVTKENIILHKKIKTKQRNEIR